VLKQFDVHRFVGRARGAFPYLVVVQSNAFRALKRRLAIPLLRRNAMPSPIDTMLPQFTIEGTRVVLSALDLGSFPENAFGERVTSLARDGDSIVAAIDLAIARGFD
jgi:toxin CcdB